MGFLNTDAALFCFTWLDTIQLALCYSCASLLNSVLPTILTFWTGQKQERKRSAQAHRLWGKLHSFDGRESDALCNHVVFMTLYRLV
jgi:hypothetical protein